LQELLLLSVLPADDKLHGRFGCCHCLLFKRQIRRQGMKTALIFGGAPITVGYWPVTGPAVEGTLTPLILDPANAELVTAFLAKN
tara:strand:+ start:1079 stop:1333 length:255 start_codon:yes stop_codon:yes gene_type:complete